MATLKAGYAVDEEAESMVLVDVGLLPWERPEPAGQAAVHSDPAQTEDAAAQDASAGVECIAGLQLADVAQGLDALPERVTLPVAGAFGLLATLLSESESRELIALGERLDMVGANSKRQYRNCDRALFRSRRLAALLWARAQPLVPPRVEDGLAFHAAETALGLDGAWEACGVNEVFRIVRYPKGGHFSPHYDGYISLGPGLRSMLTVNLYLNEGFEAGTTQFLSQSVELGRDEHLGSATKALLSNAITATVKPATGRALIFSHHVLHQGDAVGPGSPKWLLRSEVMYRRVAGSEPVKSEKQQHAEQLLAEACEAESNGRMDEAWRKYSAAFRLWPPLERMV